MKGAVLRMQVRGRQNTGGGIFKGKLWDTCTNINNRVWAIRTKKKSETTRNLPDISRCGTSESDLCVIFLPWRQFVNQIPETDDKVNQHDY